MGAAGNPHSSVTWLMSPKMVPQLPFPPSPPCVPASPGQERCEGQPLGTAVPHLCCSYQNNPTISSLPHWDQLDPNGTHPAVLPLPHLLLHCIPRLCQPSGCPGDVCQSLSCTCCHHHSVGPLEHSLCCSLWCCGPWGAALPCLLCWWGPRAAMILQPHWHCALPGGSSHRLHTLLQPWAPGYCSLLCIPCLSPISSRATLKVSSAVAVVWPVLGHCRHPLPPSPWQRPAQGNDAGSVQNFI